MTLSKLDLALVAIGAASLFWIEHNHRIVIGPLAAAEAPAPAASMCPKTDDVPYSAECIKFIGGGLAPPTLSVSAVRAELHCPPGSDGAPDGDSCVHDLSTGYAQTDRY
jgi:hypothetical protein